MSLVEETIAGAKIELLGSVSGSALGYRCTKLAGTLEITHVATAATT